MSEEQENAKAEEGKATDPVAPILDPRIVDEFNHVYGRIAALEAAVKKLAQIITASRGGINRGGR